MTDHQSEMRLEIAIGPLESAAALFRLYTQISFCFTVRNETDYDTAVATLKQGLDLLSTNIPWLAGKVDSVNDTFRIVSHHKAPVLVVKDLRDNHGALTMTELREAQFPARMLHEDLIAPCPTLSALSNDEVSRHAPVLACQITFITGGLIFTLNAQHNVMDVIGQGVVMNLLSEACHNHLFSAELLAVANQERFNLVPLLPAPFDAASAIPHQIIQQTPPQPLSSNNSEVPVSAPEIPQCAWEFFSFPAKSLANLKLRAAEAVTSGFVSTDDVLTAFIWQATMRARMSRLDPGVNCTMTRAVDARPYLRIPLTSIGALNNLVYHSLTVTETATLPLGTIAASLRHTIDPARSTIARDTQALATALHNATPQERDRISVTANLDLSRDITLSSWSKLNCYDLDFNLGLGRPECVRRPAFVPVESLFYLLPKRSDGEIVVMMCLRDVDLRRLRSDGEWNKYAQYIG